MKYITLQEIVRKIVSDPPVKTMSAEHFKAVWEFMLALYEKEKQGMRPIDPPKLDSN